MKTLLFLQLYLVIVFTACGQKNCEELNYQSIKWQEIDSKTSFYICSKSETKVVSVNLVDIQYLGIFEDGNNALKYTETDKAMFSLFANIPLGRFTVSDTTLPANIRYVLNQLTKKSEATLKYNLGNIQPNKPEQKLIIYFKDDVDSTTATKWINNLKAKSFVDSTDYLSKDAALRNWSAQDTSYNSYKSLLKDNPLPSSVDVFIKPDFVDTSFIRRLKDELRESRLVSEISNSNTLSEDDLKEVNQIFSKPYLIRIKSVE